MDILDMKIDALKKAGYMPKIIEGKLISYQKMAVGLFLERWYMG